MKLLPLILIASLFLFNSLQCKKNKESELDKLPPATQEGKRTFGCLVNGKAWVPENGNIILTDPPLKFVYENANGGLFYITAQKSIASQKIDEEINIAIDSCTTSKKFIFNNSPFHPLRFAFTDYQKNTCKTIFSKDNDVKTSGYVTITRLDLNSGIIAGTFEFTLSKLGCETINVTNGRFDGKL